MSTDIAKTEAPGPLTSAPDYITKTRRGFEDTIQTDIMIPRLALAQNGSPQATEGDPGKLEGCVPGSLFNSVTGQVYGKEVFIQVLRKMPLRAMQFRSIDDGGGVVDPDVPLGDERLKWGNTGDKKKDRPIATLFRDFLAVKLPEREIIALSFKSSGINAAKTLWGLATMANRDCFAVRLRITTGVKLTPKPHQIYKVEQAGWVSEADFTLGAETYEAVQLIDATQVHHDATPEDPDAFNPAQYEAGTGAPPTDM